MDKHPNRGSSLNSCVPRKTFSSLSYNMLFKKIWMIMPSWQCAVLRFVAQSCPTLCDPRDCSLPGSSIRGDSPGKNVGMGCHALLQGDLPNRGIKPRSPALQEDSLLSEPPGKPMNTAVGSLSLVQRIFLTQESNRGFLHCRWILYQLSYWGSPFLILPYTNNTTV